MSTAARRAIYGKLATDGGGSGCLTYHEGAGGLLGAAAAGYQHSIYLDPAPAGANFPLVLFSQTSGVPVIADVYGYAQSGTATPPPHTIIESSEIWLVKAVDHSTSADTAEQIGARIEYLLHDAYLTLPSYVTTAGTVTPYSVITKESDVSYPEEVDGEVYHHVGGNYRLTHNYTSTRT